MKNETEIQLQLEALYQELERSATKHQFKMKLGTKKDQNIARMELVTLAVQVTTLEWVLESVIETTAHEVQGE
jgi:hypothetical protein